MGGRRRWRKRGRKRRRRYELGLVRPWLDREVMKGGLPRHGIVALHEKRVGWGGGLLALKEMYRTQDSTRKDSEDCLAYVGGGGGVGWMNIL